MREKQHIQKVSEQREDIDNSTVKRMTTDREKVKNVIILSSNAKASLSFEKNINEINDLRDQQTKRGAKMEASCKEEDAQRYYNSTNLIPGFLEKESQKLINFYGSELYEFNKELEDSLILPEVLARHNIDSLTRTKMVDWMIEVLSAYPSDPQTVFLAVHIMDSYLAKAQEVFNNEDIHLIGVVSMYIASKMEDIIPLRMSLLKNKIAHNKFTEKQIKHLEKVILQATDFDLITTSTYEFIKTFVYDLHSNNQEIFAKLDMHKAFQTFDHVAIYLAKLMFHSEEFSQFK